MSDLAFYKRQVERWGKSVDRWYDRYDNETDDLKKERIFRSDGFIGARSLLIAAQADYIKQLEEAHAAVTAVQP